MLYRVEWTIDIEANSPKAAAFEALDIMQDPQSRATCFEVRENNPSTNVHKVFNIDLDKG